MAIPKYDELYPDFSDRADLRRAAAHRRHPPGDRPAASTTEEELRLPLNSQSTTVFASRVSWAGVYLLWLSPRTFSSGWWCSCC